MSMRIIAGKYRSRHLNSVKNLDLRPTSDRLRETLFDILGELVVDARFVDVFAGTGAVGIEALSRGAAQVTFIEKYPPAVALIKKNLASLEIQTGTRVLPVDALRGLEIIAKDNAANRKSLDIFFLDPPYAHTADYDRVLSYLGSATLFCEGSLVIAEHRSSFELPEAVENFQRVRVLRQGDASLSFYRPITEGLTGKAAVE